MNCDNELVIIVCKEDRLLYVYVYVYVHINKTMLHHFRNSLLHNDICIKIFMYTGKFALIILIFHHETTLSKFHFND